MAGGRRQTPLDQGAGERDGLFDLVAAGGRSGRGAGEAGGRGRGRGAPRPGGGMARQPLPEAGPPGVRRPVPDRGGGGRREHGQEHRVQPPGRVPRQPRPPQRGRDEAPRRAAPPRLHRPPRPGEGLPRVRAPALDVRGRRRRRGPPRRPRLARGPLRRAAAEPGPAGHPGRGRGPAQQLEAGRVHHPRRRRRDRAADPAEVQRREDPPLLPHRRRVRQGGPGGRQHDRLARGPRPLPRLAGDLPQGDRRRAPARLRRPPRPRRGPRRPAELPPAHPRRDRPAGRPRRPPLRRHQGAVAPRGAPPGARPRRGDPGLPPRPGEPGRRQPPGPRRDPPEGPGEDRPAATARAHRRRRDLALAGAEADVVRPQGPRGLRGARAGRVEVAPRLRRAGRGRGPVPRRGEDPAQPGAGDHLQRPGGRPPRRGPVAAPGVAAADRRRPAPPGLRGAPAPPRRRAAGDGVVPPRHREAAGIVRGRAPEDDAGDRVGPGGHGHRAAGADDRHVRRGGHRVGPAVPGGGPRDRPGLLRRRRGLGPDRRRGRGLPASAARRGR